MVYHTLLSLYRYYVFYKQFFIKRNIIRIVQSNSMLCTRVNIFINLLNCSSLLSSIFKWGYNDFTYEAISWIFHLFEELTFGILQNRFFLSFNDSPFYFFIPSFNFQYFVFSFSSFLKKNSYFISRSTISISTSLTFLF